MYMYMYMYMCIVACLFCGNVPAEQRKPPKQNALLGRDARSGKPHPRQKGNIKE